MILYKENLLLLWLSHVECGTIITVVLTFRVLVEFLNIYIVLRRPCAFIPFFCMNINLLNWLFMKCEAAWQVKMINDRTERITKVRRHVVHIREDCIDTHIKGIYHCTSWILKENRNWFIIQVEWDLDVCESTGKNWYDQRRAERLRTSRLSRWVWGCQTNNHWWQIEEYQYSVSVGFS